jgi:hypothetical protein
MKKLFFLIAMLLTINVSAQWTYKTIDNGFDPKYRIAYCTDPTSKAILKLQNIEGNSTMIYVAVYALCSESVQFDVVFLVNNEWVKYEFFQIVESSSTGTFKIITIGDNVNDAIGDNIFKTATKCKIRIYDTKCEDVDIYEFNMANSAAALQFMRAGYTQ